MLWTDLKPLGTQQAIRIRGRLCAAYMAPAGGLDAIICGSRLAHALIVKQQCADKATTAFCGWSLKVQTKCKHAPRHSTTSVNRAKAESPAIEPNRRTWRHSKT